MKKKKTKTLVLLCVLLAVLVAAYVAVTAYNKKPSGQENPSTTPSEASELALLDGTVTEMTVESEGGKLEFVLEGEEWKEKNQEGLAIKQSAFSTMTGVFGKLTTTHTVEESTQNLPEYGLEKPDYVLTARDSNGKEAVLYVGMQNTITKEYYVYVKDIPGVYTVGATAINYFKRDLMSFADVPTYPSVEEGNFLSMEIKNGEEHVKAETLTESAYDMSGILTWYVTEPFEHEYVAHSSALDEVLANIAELSYNSVAAYRPDSAQIAAMGLDNVSKELSFAYTKESSEDGEEDEIWDYHLYIGNQKEDSDYYYVQEEGSELVLLMSKTSLDAILSCTARDIVNKYFALINIESVDSVEVALGDGAEYTLDTPDEDTDENRSSALREVYQSIISIHAEKVTTSQAGPFNMLPLTITFHRNTEPKLYQIQFAEYDTSYYLAIVDGEGIYLVNKRDYSQYCEEVKEGFAGLGE